MAKKNDNNPKPRGKMSAYAFFLQVYRSELKQKNPNESVNFAEFSKRCAEKWKNMDERTKKRYNDMAMQDKARHDKEMLSYIPVGEDGKRKRRKRDPNAPKRALSAFFWYCGDERPAVKAALNNTNSVSQVAKELGRRWALIRPDQKARFEAMAAKDKIRYEKALKAYKATLGTGSGAKKGPAAQAISASDDDDEEEEDDE